MLGRVLAAVLTLIAAPAWANDSAAELPAGGLRLELRQDDQIQMKSEDLYLSQKLVKVDYVFLNRSDRDRRITVAFPMPPVKGAGATDPEPVDFAYSWNMLPDNFLDFSVQVDGVDVPAELELRAELEGQDVTEALTAAGVPLNPLNQRTLDRIKALSAGDRARVEPYLGPDGDPAWQMRATFHWQQLFPAGRELRISHRYAPVLGGTFMTPEQFNAPEEWMEDYCPDAAFLTGAARVTGETNDYGMARWMSYILHTGANWNGPIERFSLTVAKPGINTVVSFCGQGVTKISPTEFRMEARDFKPRDDLHVLWVGPAPLPR